MAKGTRVAAVKSRTAPPSKRKDRDTSDGRDTDHDDRSKSKGKPQKAQKVKTATHTSPKANPLMKSFAAISRSNNPSDPSGSYDSNERLKHEDDKIEKAPETTTPKESKEHDTSQPVETAETQNTGEIGEIDSAVSAGCLARTSHDSQFDLGHVNDNDFHQTPPEPIGTGTNIGGEKNDESHELRETETSKPEASTASTTETAGGCDGLSSPRQNDDSAACAEDAEGHVVHGSGISLCGGEMKSMEMEISTSDVSPDDHDSAKNNMANVSAETEMQFFDPANPDGFPFPSVDDLGSDSDFRRASRLLTQCREARFERLQRLFNWPFYVIDCLKRLWNTCPSPPGCSKQILGRSLNKAMASAINQKARAAVDAVIQGPTKQNDELFVDSGCTEHLTALHHSLSKTTMSTAYSGVDTPATAMAHLSWALKELLPENACNGHHHFRNLFGVEPLQRCQHELTLHPHGPDHLFVDVQDFFVPEVKQRLSSMLQRNVVHTVLVRLVQSGKACKRTAFCVIHNKECEAC